LVPALVDGWTAAFQVSAWLAVVAFIITVFAINERLDAGDIWSQTEMEIGPAETSVTLFRRMGKAGPAFLVETLKQIFAARIAPRPQDHSRATPAHALDKKESGIDWTRTASRIHNQFRAFVPWP